MSSEAITLVLRDCQLTAKNILGEAGAALRPLATDAHKAWILTGARYVGMAERLIEMAAEHARDWISLGSALAMRPAIQRALAEMRVDAESARWLVYHAAWLADSSIASGSADQTRDAAAQVRLGTGEMLKRCVDRATMAFAGPGPSAEIEPRKLVHSLLPPQALEMALDHARAAVANQVLMPNN